MAREVATANGCADKIEFFEEFSDRVTLPLRADVILSDLRGVVPLFQRHIPAIVDARRRFLAPGGTLIPRKDTLWAAIVEAPKPYSELVDPWDHNPLGQDLSAARRLVVNNAQKVRVSPRPAIDRASALDHAGLWQRREPRRPRQSGLEGRASRERARDSGLVRRGFGRGFWVLQRSLCARDNLRFAALPVAAARVPGARPSRGREPRGEIGGRRLRLAMDHAHRTAGRIGRSLYQF